MHASSLRKLAKALSLSVGYLSRRAKEPWFPSPSEHGYDVEDVRAALAANVNQRKGAPHSAGAAAAQPAKPGPAPKFDEQSTALLAKLKAGDATSVEISDAAMRLSAQRVAEGLAAGNMPAKALEDLKKSLEELRRNQEADMKLAERRGELIERDISEAVVGQMVQRLNRILDNFESILPQQFEIYLGDEAFCALPADERARQIREWTNAQARELRLTEAATIRKAIDCEILERKGG